MKITVWHLIRSDMVAGITPFRTPLPSDKPAPHSSPFQSCNGRCNDPRTLAHSHHSFTSRPSTCPRYLPRYVRLVSDPWRSTHPSRGSVSHSQPTKTRPVSHGAKNGLLCPVYIGSPGLVMPTHKTASTRAATSLGVEQPHALMFLSGWIWRPRRLF